MALQISLERFNGQEIEVWLTLEHQDVVELYGVVLYGNVVYILQELVTGM